MMGLRLGMKGSAGPSKSIRSDVTGLAFTSGTLHSVSVRLAVSAERLVVEVLVGTVELWGSGRLTLKGLLGTLIPPQVTATVCLMAEVGVYEQEYTPSPLFFTFTSMGSPSAFWDETRRVQSFRIQENCVDYTQYNEGGFIELLHDLLEDGLTWARIFRGPFPASLASTVNSAGLLMMHPVFSRPGP